jgi:hypothetical protein
MAKKPKQPQAPPQAPQETAEPQEAAAAPRSPRDASERSGANDVSQSRRSHDTSSNGNGNGKQQGKPHAHNDETSSVLSSPSNRRAQQHRPRFDSRASWADSTRFDMGRADSRASDISARDLRLTALSGGPKQGHNRNRADSRASRLSQSSRSSNRSRMTSFVSNFGATKPRKESNALSTITEHWNLPEDEFGSPFQEFDAQGEVKRTPGKRPERCSELTICVWIPFRRTTDPRTA